MAKSRGRVRAVKSRQSIFRQLRYADRAARRNHFHQYRSEFPIQAENASVVIPLVPSESHHEMAPRIARNPKSRQKRLFDESAKRPSLPATALFSFLKETRGITSWNTRDFAKTLNLSTANAKEALAILEMQGYIKPTESKGEWITTPAGESVSGSKFPKYSRESVERSLDSFADHLKRINQDSSAEYKIADAVAFGDFLSGRARVQAADVGIRLEPRNPAAHHPHWAGERERQEAFLKQLRGKTPLLNLQLYAEWMSTRTHRKLLGSG
jgi:DNA-binding transcriptional regulator YhcF (GntR family)